MATLLWRRVSVWRAALAVFAVVIGLVVIVALMTGDERQIDVEYRVLANGLPVPTTASITITWKTAAGALQQQTNAPLPWAYAETMDHFAELTVAARMHGGPAVGGALRCEVWVNGSLYQGFDAAVGERSVACNALYEEGRSP